MKTNYIETNSGEMGNYPIITGQVMWLTDKESLYLDYNGQRHDITDSVDIEADIFRRNYHNSKDAEKFVFVKNVQEFYRWTGFEWNAVQVDLVMLRLLGISSSNFTVNNIIVVKESEFAYLQKEGLLDQFTQYNVIED